MLDASFSSAGMSRPAAVLSLLAHALFFLLLVAIPVPPPGLPVKPTWHERIALLAPARPAPLHRINQEATKVRPPAPRIETLAVAPVHRPRRPSTVEPAAPPQLGMQEPPPSVVPIPAPIAIVAPPSRAAVKTDVLQAGVATATVPSSPISVRTGGFTAGVTGGPSQSAPTRHAVRGGGFADVVAQAAAPARPLQRPQSDTLAVEILFKPQPVYSDEARRLRIEGSVLLDVVFTRLGQVEVVRVVKGLGHGLDEKAVEAARQIRFKAARQDGNAVDFPATIRILFGLAY